MKHESSAQDNMAVFSRQPIWTNDRYIPLRSHSNSVQIAAVSFYHVSMFSGNLFSILVFNLRATHGIKQRHWFILLQLLSSLPKPDHSIHANNIFERASRTADRRFFRFLSPLCTIIQKGWQEPEERTMSERSDWPDKRNFQGDLATHREDWEICLWVEGQGQLVEGQLEGRKISSKFSLNVPVRRQIKISSDFILFTRVSGACSHTSYFRCLCFRPGHRCHVVITVITLQ